MEKDLEWATDMVEDLIQAHRDYEHCIAGTARQTRADYLLQKHKVIEALRPAYSSLPPATESK